MNARGIDDYRGHYTVTWGEGPSLNDIDGLLMPGGDDCYVGMTYRPIIESTCEMWAVIKDKISQSSLTHEFMHCTLDGDVHHDDPVWKYVNDINAELKAEGM